MSSGGKPSNRRSENYRNTGGHKHTSAHAGTKRTTYRNNQQVRREPGSAVRYGSKRRRSGRRKRRFARIVVTAAVILIAVGIIAGIRAVTRALGPEDYDAPTAEFRRNGSIRVTSIESFDQTYYDQNELADSIRSAVSEYNSANGENSVKEESFDVADGNAKVVLIYKSAEDYQNFNNTALFTGTVQDAEEAGYDFESIMQAVSNQDSSTILTQATLDQLLSNHTIILTEQVNVVLPRRWEILYATPNLGVTDFQHATAIDTISDEKPAIVILK